MKDLEVSTRDKIDGIFREARAKVDSAECEAGIKLAEFAWEQVPEPKFGWDVSKSYAQALARLYRDCSRFREGISLMDSLLSSGTVKPHQDQPYFVLGTIYFEMGDFDSARKWLREADRISRGRCFQGQPKKYKEMLGND